MITQGQEFSSWEAHIPYQDAWVEYLPLTPDGIFLLMQTLEEQMIEFLLPEGDVRIKIPAMSFSLGPVLAIISIWGVTQQMAELTLPCPK